MNSPSLSRNAWAVAFLFFPFGPFVALRVSGAVTTLQCILGLLVAATFHAGIISVLAATNGERWQIYPILLLGAAEFSLGCWQYLAGLRASLWSPAALKYWRLSARFFGGLLTVCTLVTVLAFHVERRLGGNRELAPDVPVVVREGKFAPLKSFDFTTGDWEAEIHITSSDFANLDKRVPRATVLYTRDRAVLADMRRKWVFKKTEGDLATVESSITIRKGGHPVFDAGIVFDAKPGGLQSRQFGWTPAADEDGFFGPVSRFEPR